MPCKSSGLMTIFELRFELHREYITSLKLVCLINSSIHLETCSCLGYMDNEYQPEWLRNRSPG